MNNPIGSIENHLFFFLTVIFNMFPFLKIPVDNIFLQIVSEMRLPCFVLNITIDSLLRYSHHVKEMITN